MQAHREQHSNVKLFWKNQKDECCQIKQIDKVYDMYVKYHIENKENKYNPMNRYIFRTFIRKNGYNNS
jgi:hypothetical protein